ncbi:MAG TPA: hypothetical protein VMS09_02125 [Paenibacillus sp.]|uniref:hypothetical protein n=1 Tax=Paenibacillus sp. TaxID=58172 RepID=UPI0028D721A7|nr:hypothetical protein [Paenibacillus sp.]HUC90805.1 hypothetical protein [Paenibacillus sp.]
MNQQNPLLLSVVGVFLLIFGVTDIIFLNKIVGIGLTVAGLAIGVAGLKRWNDTKKR